MSRKGAGVVNTSYPVPCPHCKKFVYNPPAWIRVMEAMFELRKEFGAAVANGAALARHMGVSRERGRQLLGAAEKYGVIEPFIKFSGVFKPSQRGYMYYRAWRRCGWTGKPVKGQQSLRKEVYSKGLSRGQKKFNRKGGNSSEVAAAIAVLKERVDEERRK